MSDDHAIVPSPPVAEQSDQLHPLVAALSRGDLDSATMREVMDMQREWQVQQSRQAYTEALVSLKRALPAVLAHDKRINYKAKGGRVAYSHLSLAGFMDAINGSVGEHGFSLTFGGHVEGAEVLNAPRQGDITVSATLTHVGGHSHSVELSAPPDTGSGRNGIQAVASTTTYLRRYAAAMILGIATSDMPDVDAPPAEPEPDSIDVARNQRAAAWLEREGLSVYDAEEYFGRPTAEWTAADLGSLRAWAREKRDSETV